MTVALERRLGTTNGYVGWPILGAAGRVAFASALAGALLALHRCPASSYDSLTQPSSTGGPLTLAWREPRVLDGSHSLLHRRTRHFICTRTLFCTTCWPG